MEPVHPFSPSFPGSPRQVGRARYLEALDWLYQFADYERRPGGHSFSLERPRALLRQLGDPQNAFQSVVVAGTKGKGSTAVMLQALLDGDERRIGLYTQPHLHTFRERIRIGDAMVREDELADFVQALADAVQAVHAQRPELGRLTTYEIGTAAALLYFANQHVIWAVLEVGLGGRLDAVNAVESSMAVLTPISLDHTDLLGSTIAEIAAEKAGIIHPEAVVVSAPQTEEAMAVFRDTSRRQRARLDAVAPSDLRLLKRTTFPPGLSLPEMRARSMLEFELRSWPVPLALPLGGWHQALNAATALRTATTVRPDISTDQARAALGRVSWPGRLEVVAARPTVVVDGAHNGASAACLARAVREHFRWRRLLLVIGTSDDKDVDAIMSPLVALADTAVATQARSPRARPAVDIGARLRSRLDDCHVASNVAEALELALTRASPEDLVLVTGSLFVVAESRAYCGLASEGP